MKIFSIYGGRTAFWQWDLGQRLVVSDDTCSEVHFDNGTTEKALVCKVKEENGTRFVDVPNIFLRSDRLLKVFAYVKNEAGQYTKHSEMFDVLQRPKPEDYVYTETEVLTWEALDQRIKNIEDSLLIVTLDGSSGMASHTSTQIYNHIKKGGSVLLSVDMEYYIPDYISETEVVAYLHLPDFGAGQLTIREDGSAGVTLDGYALVVTVTGLDNENGKSSHTPTEIYNFVKSGGNVFIYIDGIDLYFSPTSISTSEVSCYVHFHNADTTTADALLSYITILNDGRVYIKTEEYAFKSDIGDIDTALDGILAIQETLIGGGTV